MKVLSFILLIIVLISNVNSENGVCVFLLPNPNYRSLPKPFENQEVDLGSPFELTSQCCSGYQGNYPDEPCTPICKLDCINATCTAPETCTCLEGFTKTSPNICEPVTCDPPCINGECVATNTCACDDDFTLSEHLSHVCKPRECENGFVRDPVTKLCEPQCDNGCVNGKCTAPNWCLCNIGYRIVNESFCKPYCPRECINGKCVAPFKCECNEGYHKPPFSYPSKCEPFCKSGCENGECVSPDNCVCNSGYVKDKDNICRPKCNSNCTNGICVAPDTCECTHGYVQSLNGCVPACHNCTNGNCIEPNVCTCNTGYAKSSEKYFHCEPICEGGCTNGVCEKPGKCVCNPGFSKITENGECTPICTRNCTNGKCTAPEVCSCDSGYQMKNGSCELSCEIECFNGTCEANVCTCTEGWTGKDCSERKLIEAEDKRFIIFKKPYVIITLSVLTVIAVVFTVIQFSGSIRRWAFNVI